MGEAGCVLQRRGGNRTTSSCCDPVVATLGFLPQMGAPSVLYFSVHVFSFQYLFKMM